ncbi:MAG: DUF814 domain-containing protein [Gemmatimonadales bacterium]|nr:DUF814 domain-containing protein [Gemmatimonadales bacterium]
MAETVAVWRTAWTGRDLFRAVAGPGWLRLNLVGPERPCVLLTSLPGAALILAGQGQFPDPLHRALARTTKHPLTALLSGRTLTGLGLLPDDRVVALRFHKNESEPFVLLHQLFGPRGNTALLDDRNRLLWAVQRPPHSLLASFPPRQTWETGTKTPDTSPAEETHTDFESLGFAADEISAAALDRLIRQQILRLEQESGSALNRQLATSKRLGKNLAQDLARAERGEEFRRKAETLAVHLHGITAGLDKVTLADPRDGSDVEIELDPKVGPAGNLEAWFRRARKADKGREIIRVRWEEAVARERVLTLARQELTTLQDSESSPVDYLGSLQDWIDGHEDLLPRKKATGRTGPEEQARPFRRYLLDKRWEVWIGRNNKENDLLTFGASHGKDIWLHAQGVPGSHVILRSGGKPEQIPRSIIEKAAALAAQHCRSKHSALVPVIWTERRYVRKPRKSAPGMAVCLREKSIFVEPGLPPGAEAI